MDRKQKSVTMSSVTGVEMGEDESGDRAPITQIDLEPLVSSCSTLLMLNLVT